ncbi:TIGR03960 family B12-binding radical SAM protein, partial [bacterium]
MKTREITRIRVDDLLTIVEKPSRYLGLEINSVHKSPSEVQLRSVLAFPDLYEVGMSHLGTQILYGLGNEQQGVQVERVFLPQTDMLEALKNRGIPLFTLESRTPLFDCDLIGITLQSELTYTNVLTILDAAQIPIKAGDRSEDMPLVVAGGPCAFNPEPMWEFFDLFLLGDGEEVWPAMLDVLKEIRVNGGSRDDMLAAASKIPGAYDPAAFQIHYRENETVDRAQPKDSGDGIVKARCMGLDQDIPVSSFMVPFVQPVHDRISIEAARGCTRGCRFCHAGMVYRPVRERSQRAVMDAAERALEVTGYEDLSLTALSIGDYGPLDEVLAALMDRYEDNRISMSLPSMRIGGLTPEVARQIKRVRKTGFTIAPEAGTQRLRKVVNKDFTDDEIVESAGWVFQNGWDAVKLYFMIGLPTETRDDLEGIVALVGKVAARCPDRGQVTVNLSPFVPKAHTPFQWAGQDPEKEMKEKLEYLRSRLKGKKIQVRWGRTDQALLEAVLARGDRKVAHVVEAAWRRGARFDGWEEHFDWKIWKEAFDECGLDPCWYAERARGEDEVFPWDHLSSGVTKEFLRKEYQRGLMGEVTGDCREVGCRTCGVCLPEQSRDIPPLRDPDVPAELDLPRTEDSLESEKSLRRIRVVFKKTGDLRYLGHLETMRALERGARRAKIPLAFSGGYHPKPKITLALALPLGVEGEAEWADFELLESWSPEKLMEGMNQNLPKGLEILRAWKAPYEGQSLNVRAAMIDFRAQFPDAVEDLEKKVRFLLDSEDVPVVREKKG